MSLPTFRISLFDSKQKVAVWTSYTTSWSSLLGQSVHVGLVYSLKLLQGGAEFLSAKVFLVLTFT